VDQSKLVVEKETKIRLNREKWLVLDKQRVLERYPEAYCIVYGVTSCIYREPVKPQPRGEELAAVVLGSGAGEQAAWNDAVIRKKLW
jgi:hypothetical protein